MEFRQLSHFVAVAEEESFTRAAHRAHIVQSGISASIASLERELGVALFKRSKHGVELTDAGKALLIEARKAISAVNAGRAAALTAGSGLSGRLAIGLSANLRTEFGLADVLREFREVHPDVHIQVLGLYTAPFDDLRNGAVDVVIGPANAPPGIHATPLRRYPVQLAVAEGHPLAGRASVALSEFANEPFIDVLPGWMTRRIVDRAFTDARCERHTVFEVNQLELLLELVRAGLGVSLIPCVEAPVLGVRMVPVDPPIGDWEVGISVLGDAPAAPAAQVFVKMLMAAQPTPEGLPAAL